MTTSTQPPARSVFRSPRFLLLLALLAVLTAAGVLGLDCSVAAIVRKQEPDWIHQLAVWISLSGGIGIYPFTALVVFCWAWWGRPNRGLRRACLWVLTAEAATAVLARVLKIAFGRWRPDQVLGGHFEFFVPFKSKCHSFPSGHTADAAAVAAVLWFVYPRWRPLYVAWVALMALARVGAEQHFMADAATGAALGVLCALAVGRNLDAIVRWIERRLFLQLITWTGMGVAIMLSLPLPHNSIGAAAPRDAVGTTPAGKG